VAGVALGALILRAMKQFDVVPARAIDGRMLAVAGLLSVVVGALCAIWPSVGAVRSSTHDALRTSSRVSAGRRQRRIADVLVAAEVALAFVLLVGTALMVGTVSRAMGVDIGFDRRNVLTFKVFPSRDRYPDVKSTLVLYDRMTAAIDAMPGTLGTAVTSTLPLGSRMGASLVRQDHSIPPGTTAPEVVYSSIRPGFFRAMRIPVLAGREFELRDLDDSVHVTVISSGTARAVFAGENPIGKRISLGAPQGNDWHEIIGVVGDVRQDAVTSLPVRSAYDLYGEHWNRSMWVVVRTTAPASSVAATIRSRLRDIDPELPMYSIASMEERAAQSIVDRRLLLRLLAVFGGVALTLCAVGIYGVTAQAVGQRRVEVGIRMALGATGGRVRREVFGRAFWMVAVGLLVGGVGALGGARVVSSLLYGVSASDPRWLLGSAVGLGCVALLAAWIPARRASLVDPIEVMRAD
jgi:predicted permease